MQTLEAPPTPAVAPASTPSAAPSTPASNGGNAFQEIDALFADAPPEEPKPAAPAEPTAVKPTQAKPGEKPTEKPAQKPAEKPQDKKPDEKKQGDEFKGAAQLRKAYEDSKAEIARLNKLLEEKSKPVEDPEKLTLKQQYEELQKRHQETDGELRFVRYEKSQEYRDKYEKPMHKALADAEGEISELMLTDGEGSERKATIQDFAALVDMPLQKAITQAKAWFGDAATEVLAHRRKVVDLSKSAKEAIEDYKKRGSELEKQKTAETEKQHAQIASTWENLNKQLRTNKADLFGPAEGDDEGNSLLEKWTNFTDLALNPRSELPTEKRIQFLALVRNKAAAFDREVHRSKQKDSKIAALEKELQEFKASVPGNGTKPKNPDVKKAPTLDESLMKYATA